MHELPTFLHSSSSLVNEERMLDTAMRQVKRKKAFFLRILSFIGYDIKIATISLTLIKIKFLVTSSPGYKHWST